MNKEFENPFKNYKDTHRGESAIFFGSGPSILNFDINKVKSDVIKIGLNDQIFLDLDLDYWFMGDSHRQEFDYFYGRYESYNEYKPKKQKFIRICNWAPNQYVTLNGVKVPRNGQLPLDMKYSKYYVANSAGNSSECLFNEDLGEGHLNAVASITFEALQFILYTGVEKLFLIGHDCDYTTGTFRTQFAGQHVEGNHMLQYWPLVKDWVEKNYPDVNIYSINPVALNIFPEAQIEDIKC